MERILESPHHHHHPLHLYRMSVFTKQPATSTDMYRYDLLFESYGAPGCAFCYRLINDSGRPPNSRSAFAQEAVSVHGTLPRIRSLIPLERVEGGLADPLADSSDIGNGAREARFRLEGGLTGSGMACKDITVRFNGHWSLEEQLDLMEALRQGLEAGCDHSWRARMRIERRCS